MIIGGGRTTIFLAKQLLEMGVKVKIIERDEKRCEFLTEMLPGAMIICGDATDKNVLMEEGLLETEAFVANTELKLEKNVIIGCITHKGKTTIAKGQSVIRVGDTVILITTRTGLHDIRDVVK